MIRPLLILVLVTAGLFAASATVAAAQMVFCGPRDRVVASLTDRYGEAHRASGLQSTTRMVEVWVSDASGTWTILVTRPDGTTCVGASGTHWQAFEPGEAPRGVAS